MTRKEIWRELALRVSHNEISCLCWELNTMLREALLGRSLHTEMSADIMDDVREWRESVDVHTAWFRPSVGVPPGRTARFDYCNLKAEMETDNE